MSTITISVDDSVEKEFRDEVHLQLGKNKGVLGKAITEAMELWIHEKKQRQIAQELTQIMKKGFRMGKMTFADRDELYER